MESESIVAVSGAPCSVQQLPLTVEEHGVPCVIRVVEVVADTVAKAFWVAGDLEACEAQVITGYFEQGSIAFANTVAVEQEAVRAVVAIGTRL